MANLAHTLGLSPLYQLAPSSSPQPQDSRGIIRLADASLRAKINLRCSADNPIIAKGLSRCVGVGLPTTANRFHQSGKRCIIWLAPDEWLICAEHGVAPSIIAELDTGEAGHCAITDVSDALGILTLEGEHIRDALAKHCPLDLHPSVFGVGVAQQSLLSHANVTILCRTEDKFELIGRASFMPYIAELMIDAALEYGYDYRPAPQ